VAQWTGIGARTAGRLRGPMGIAGDDIEAIAKIFQIHPCFHPRAYVDFRVEITGPRSARIAIGDCPALEEGDPYSWFAGLGAAPHRALDAIAGAINPRARCVPVASPAEARLAWDVVIDPSVAPQEEPAELKLGRLSRGATFQLEQRRALRM
jgi:hypothetical protein